MMRQRLETALAARLHALGEAVARRPGRTIAAAVAASLLLSLGLLNVRLETRVERVWVPQGAESIAQLDYLDERFDAFPRLAQVIVRPADADASAFDEPEIARAMDLHEAVLALGAGEAWQLRAPDAAGGVCYTEWPAEGAPCRSEGLWQLFEGGPEAVREASRNQTSFLATLEENAAALSTLAGPVEVRDGRLWAGSLRFHYYALPADPPRRLLDPPSERNERVLRWEGEFLRLVNSGGGRRTLGAAGRSVDDEVNRAVSDQAVFIVGAIALVVFFVAVCMSPSLRETRVLLGCSTVLTVVLAEAGGFGLVSLFIPFTQVVMLLLFVLIAIGVDDALLLADFFDSVPPADVALGIEHRLGVAMSHAGLSMLVTSATSCVAFAVSSTLDFPGVSYFCATAAACVVLLYALTCTFFAALLVCDQRRRDARREKPAAAERPAAGGGAGGLFRRFLAGWWAPLVTGRRASCAVVAVALGVAAAGAASAGALGVGLDLADAFPDGSYLVAFWDLQEELYDTLQGELLVVARGDDLEPRLDDLEALAAAVGSDPNVVAPVESWQRDMALWLEATPSAAGLPFAEALRLFLDADPFVPAGATRPVVPRASQRRVAWSEDGERLVASVFRTYTSVSESVGGRVDQTRELRAAVARAYPAGAAFPWAWIMVYADRDSRLLDLVYSTLAWAAVAVLATSALFVSPTSVAFVAVAVACSDAALLGVMYAAGVPIDGASFVILGTSVGILVDQVLHVAHQFDHAPGPSAARVSRALETVGLSVAKGGTSTLVGCSVLAFSKSGLFRKVFFRLLVAIAGLGLLAGLALFPALASLLGSDRAQAAALPATSSATHLVELDKPRMDDDADESSVSVEI